MKRVLILASLACLACSAMTEAQPVRPSSCAMFAAELARNLGSTLQENDALAAKNLALTVEIEPLKKAKAEPVAPMRE